MDLGWSKFSSSKGHTRVGFCGGAALGCGSTFGYKEGEPGNSAAMGGEPSWGASFSWLSVPNTICLVGSLLGYTTTPYLRQGSLISLSQKKSWTEGISVHLPCLLQNKSGCRMVFLMPVFLVPQRILWPCSGTKEF